MRAKVEMARQLAREKHLALVEVRDSSVRAGRVLSATLEQTAALKRQVAMIVQDNNDLQSQLIRMESGLFPGVFPPTHP
jgi:hypothetical protein